VAQIIEQESILTDIFMQSIMEK